MSEQNKPGELDCSVVKDLLPSYVDGLTSEETSRLVTEHLRQCPGCNGSYYYMKAQMELPQKKNGEIGVRFLKKQMMKRIAWALAALLLLLALSAAVIGFMNSPIQIDDQEVRLTGLYELSTGEIVCAFQVEGVNPSAGYINMLSISTDIGRNGNAAYAGNYERTLGLTFYTTRTMKLFSNDSRNGDTFYYSFFPDTTGGIDSYVETDEKRKVMGVSLWGDGSRIWWPERNDVKKVSGQEEEELIRRMNASYGNKPHDQVMAVEWEDGIGPLFTPTPEPEA